MQARYKCGDKMLHRAEYTETYQTKCQWGIFILLLYPEARRFLSCDKTASPYFIQESTMKSPIDFLKFF